MNHPVSFHEFRKISMFLSRRYTKEWKLFLIEFVFTWPKISLLGEQIFVSFNPILASKIPVTVSDQSMVLQWLFRSWKSRITLFPRFIKSTGKLLWKIELWYRNFFTFQRKSLAKTALPEFVRWMHSTQRSLLLYFDDLQTQKYLHNIILLISEFVNLINVDERSDWL